jgi:hypothetical protein
MTATHRSLTLLLLTCLLVGAPTLAQFGKITDKFKKEVKGANVPGTNSQQPAGDLKQQQRDARIGEVSQKNAADKHNKGALDRKTDLTSPEFDQKAHDERFNSRLDLDLSSQPALPTVAWYSLLDRECLMFDIAKGELRLSNIEVAFLPKKTKTGADVDYEKYLDPQGVNPPSPPLRVDVVEASTGAFKGQQYFTAQPYITPFHTMKAMSSYLNFFPIQTTLKEGSYELRFFAGTSHFYTFPFRVEKQTNPDPYSPVKDFYFLRGPWEEWGHMEVDNTGEVKFSFYSTERTTTIKSQSSWDDVKTIQVQTRLFRNSKQIAVYGINNDTTEPVWTDRVDRNGTWTKHTIQLFTYPGNPQNRKLLQKEALTDGSYLVDVRVKDPATGKVSTQKYPFVVRGGAFVPAAKADRAQHTDPLTFLEQGTSCRYVKRVN